MRLIIALLISLFVLEGLQAEELSNVAVFTSEKSAELSLILQDKVDYEVFTMLNPDRLVVDLQGVALASDAAVSLSGKGIISAIRHARRNADDFRVVLDLRNAVTVTHSFESSPEIGRVNLVVKLLPAKIIKSKASQLVKKQLVVALDAGHGGIDSGAVGPTGTLEKEITLDVALNLYKILQKGSQTRAVLARADDRRVKLRSRVAVARENNADLFISIHADAIQNRKVRGSSVYVLSHRGASSELARRLAFQANTSDFIGTIKRENKGDDLWETLVDLSQKATSEESIKVAASILSHLNAIGPVHKKKVQHAGFMVLKSLDIPSVLVEMAFISNPYEERRLNDRGFRREVARAIYRGICTFFEIEPDSLTMSTSQNYVVRGGDTLSSIAYRYGTSVKELKLSNNLSSTVIRHGQVLVIP